MYEIFEQLLKERGLSIVEFSRLVGIPKSTLYDWKKGKFQLKEDKRHKIAQFFDVSIEYLDGKTDIRESYDWKNRYYSVHETYTVPIHRIAAGRGCFNPSISDDYVEKENDGFEYATVVGDSMLPELRDGDIVKIEPTAETTPHDYTCIKVDGEHATIKFVEITQNGVWLRALNKEVYEDKFFSIQEVMTLPVTIIGKVVSLERKF